MKTLLAALSLFVTPLIAAAQSSPGLITGQVPSAAQWNSYFAAKQDYSSSSGNPLNVKSFGAQGNGIFDDTSAILAAMNLSINLGPVYFPCGNYKITSPITINLAAGASISVTGAGADCVLLNFTNNSGIIVNYGNQFSSTHWRGFAIGAGQAGGGAAITLAQAVASTNPASGATSDFSAVTVRGSDGYGVTDYWGTGFSVQNVSNVNWYGVSVTGPNPGVSFCGSSCGVGIILAGVPASTAYGVAYNVASSAFNFNTYGIEYGSYVQGLTVNQTNFTGDKSGIYVPAGDTGILSLLSVANSQFASGANNIDIEALMIGPIITGNFFQIATSSAGVFAISQWGTFSGNTFFIAGGASSTTGIALTGPSGTQNTITGNVFNDLTTGWSTTSGTNFTKVIGNAYVSDAANYSDSSTTSSIGDASGTGNNFAFKNLNISGQTIVSDFIDNNVFITRAGTPTYTSGFSTGTPGISGVTTAAFLVTLGATPQSTGVLGMPAASSGWSCTGVDRTTAAGTIRQTASATNSITFALGSTMSGDTLQFQCMGY